MSQKLPVNNFEWIKNTSQFHKDFIKNYEEESDKWNFLKVDRHYLEKLDETHNDLPFLPESMQIKKIEKLLANLHDKTEYVRHKKFKTSVELWIILGEISQSD